VDSDREEGEGPGDMLQAWLGELDTLKKVSRALKKGQQGSRKDWGLVESLMEPVRNKKRFEGFYGVSRLSGSQHEGSVIRGHCRSQRGISRTSMSNSRSSVGHRRFSRGHSKSSGNRCLYSAGQVEARIICSYPEKSAELQVGLHDPIGSSVGQ